MGQIGIEKGRGISTYRGWIHNSLATFFVIDNKGKSNAVLRSSADGLILLPCFVWGLAYHI